MTFSVQSTYTFDTLAPAILGGRFTRAVMLGELSYELAMGRENVLMQYRQIYPSLPVGTPDTPKLARYYVFRTESGEMVVLCDQWIDLTSVVLVEGVNFSFHFVQGLPADVYAIRDLLTAAGYNNFTSSI